MVSFKHLEIPYCLIQSYADLSLMHKRKLEKLQNPSKYDGFTHNFALLGLNGAIVEGTLRSIISWHLHDESEKATKKGIANGQAGPDLAERTLKRLHAKIDTEDTWSKLKEEFKFVFGKTVSTVATPALLGEIEHLFTIRNRIAHGSSIQIPTSTINQEDDEYLFLLQNKLSTLTSYFQKKYGVADIYEGLGHQNAANDFWITTQQFFKQFAALYTFPAELVKTLVAIDNYTFATVFNG